MYTKTANKDDGDKAHCPFDVSVGSVCTLGLEIASGAAMQLPAAFSQGWDEQQNLHCTGWVSSTNINKANQSKAGHSGELCPRSKPLETFKYLQSFFLIELIFKIVLGQVAEPGAESMST